VKRIFLNASLYGQTKTNNTGQDPKKEPDMKKILIIAVSLLSAMAVSFGNPVLTRNNSYNRSVGKTEAAFHTIVVNDDVDVILVESDRSAVDIKGAGVGAEAVKFHVRNGKLYIGSKSGSLKDKVTVYVNVSRLASLEVNGSSRISNQGVLNSTILRVRVNGEALIDLKNYGEILFYSDDSIRLKFKKLVKRLAITLAAPARESFLQADEEMEMNFREQENNRSKVM
jgi:hypothetical protein